MNEISCCKKLGAESLRVFIKINFSCVKKKLTYELLKVNNFKQLQILTFLFLGQVGSDMSGLKPEPTWPSGPHHCSMFFNSSRLILEPSCFFLIHKELKTHQKCASINRGSN